MQVNLGNEGVTDANYMPGAKPPEQETGKNDAIKDALGSVLNSLFIEWRDARPEKENKWLQVLRSYNGQYDPADLAKLQPGQSKIFVHLTRTKTVTAYSRIIDLMLGHGNHWNIEPTPIPELSPEGQEQVETLIDSVAPGFNPTPEETKRVSDKIASDAAAGMRTLISDQLSEVFYERIFKSAVFECCQLGTGCIKGPFVRSEQKKKWSGSAGTGWAIEVTDAIMPGLEAPSIWDIYPDPYCTSVDDAIGIFERHVVTAKQLTALKSYPGFDAAAIDDVLMSYPNGNHEEYSHETERRRINGVTNTTPVNKRYDLMEYWGQVTGHQLNAAGVSIPADKLHIEYQANVWFCGNRAVRTQLNPLMPERIPYQIFQYERVPFSIWGVGVGEQMTDSQAVINAAVRTTLDNTGISSGPQVEVNMQMLADGEDPRDIYPWRVWPRKGGDPTAPMLRFYQPDNVSAGLMQITEVFRKFADEETNLPSYTHGETMPGLNKTATGMSMLMGAANIATKSVIKNIDADCVEPMIRGYYDFNMHHSDDDSIKSGDLKVKATGSTTLMSQEVQSQRLIQYAEMTNNPFDIQLMGPMKRAGLLRSVAKAMDLDPDEVAPDDPKESAQPTAQTGMPGTVPQQVPGAMPGQMQTAVPPDGAGAVNVSA